MLVDVDRFGLRGAPGVAAARHADDAGPARTPCPNGRRFARAETALTARGGAVLAVVAAGLAAAVLLG